MGKLVTVVTCDDVAIASIARSKLEAAGIPCFLTNEHLIGMNWLYVNAVTGVDVQVPETFKEEALLLLTENFHPENIRDDDAAVTDDIREGLAEADAPCPECGATDIANLTLRRSFAALFYLLALPMVFRPRWKKCRACGHRWR